MPDQLPAMARHANDPLDRCAALAEIQDRGGCFLPTQITFILEPLRAGEKLWTDCHCSEVARIGHIDLRMAIRIAALAFSMRCSGQRPG